MKKTKISEKEKPECLNALKAYFYEDLSTKPKKNDIINLALNYFFEGIYDSKNESWKEKYNKVITEDSENKILKVKVPKNTIPVKDLEEETRNYWKKINELNEDLIRERVKKNEVIDKTLIYEAPPFHITRKDKKESRKKTIEHSRKNSRTNITDTGYEHHHASRTEEFGFTSFNFSCGCFKKSSRC